MTNIQTAGTVTERIVENAMAAGHTQDDAYLIALYSEQAQAGGMEEAREALDRIAAINRKLDS